MSTGEINDEREARNVEGTSEKPPCTESPEASTEEPMKRIGADVTSICGYGAITRPADAHRGHGEAEKSVQPWDLRPGSPIGEAD